MPSLILTGLAGVGGWVEANDAMREHLWRAHVPLWGHSLMVQQVKNPSATLETPDMWVRSLSREDPLEREVATHSSILA